MNFNTSHVSVILISLAISSTVIFYFNTSHVSVIRLYIPLPPYSVGIFQYISCIGYTNIYNRRRYNDIQIFNTSHVSVIPLCELRVTFTLYYFNTSHVSVIRYNIAYTAPPALISIHLMYRLYNVIRTITTHPKPISIHLMYRLYWRLCRKMRLIKRKTPPLDRLH